jgi:hypothetical protein
VDGWDCALWFVGGGGAGEVKLGKRERMESVMPMLAVVWFQRIKRNEQQKLAQDTA